VTAAGVTSPRTRHARRLFAGLPASYDRMGALLSFGQDPRWRRFMVSRLNVGHGDRVLDVATGTAMVAREVVRRTGASVVGLDQSPEMLSEAVRATAASPEAGGVRFVLAQGERLPFADGAFDALTFTYLFRYVDDPPAVMRELARVVKPGGTVANLEFDVPSSPVLLAGWRTYTRLGLPALGRLVSKEWFDVGRFLGPSIEGFYSRHPLADQLGWWRDGGIEDVRWRVMSFGAGVVIWGRRSHAG
jgi:demethylmenaquinone methyltransferase/2-methoxy-6-polyprenyl-1,4-benzoquinol methylase